MCRCQVRGVESSGREGRAERETERETDRQSLSKFLRCSWPRPEGVYVICRKPELLSF